MGYITYLVKFTVLLMLKIWPLLCRIAWADVAVRHSSGFEEGKSEEGRGEGGEGGVDVLMSEAMSAIPAMYNGKGL